MVHININVIITKRQTLFSVVARCVSPIKYQVGLYLALCGGEHLKFKWTS